MSFASRIGSAVFLGQAILIAASGYWVSGRIEQSVLNSSARSHAMFMEGVIGPHVQELANEQGLSASSSAELSELDRKSTRLNSSHRL